MTQKSSYEMRISAGSSDVCSSAIGKVDWYTYSGYRRYHSECHTCHGPDGLGSSFGPNLTQSLKAMSSDDFLALVVNGRQNRIGRASCWERRCQFHYITDVGDSSIT